MSRLTKQTKFNYYYLKTTDGIHIDVLNDYGEVFIGTAVEKLAEYENLGSVEELNNINHELEVYKRALKKANKEWDDLFTSKMKWISAYDLPTEDEKESLSKTELNRKVQDQIRQARKELEDERK